MRKSYFYTKWKLVNFGTIHGPYHFSLGERHLHAYCVNINSLITVEIQARWKIISNMRFVCMKRQHLHKGQIIKLLFFFKWTDSLLELCHKASLYYQIMCVLYVFWLWLLFQVCLKYKLMLSFLLQLVIFH